MLTKAKFDIKILVKYIKLEDYIGMVVVHKSGYFWWLV